MVNFGHGASPEAQKVKCNNALNSHEPGVTNWPVTMLHLVSHRWLGQHVRIYASRDNWHTCY